MSDSIFSFISEIYCACDLETAHDREFNGDITWEHLKLMTLKLRFNFQTS